MRPRDHPPCHPRAATVLTQLGRQGSRGSRLTGQSEVDTSCGSSLPGASSHRQLEGFAKASVKIGKCWESFATTRCFPGQFSNWDVKEKRERTAIRKIQKELH